MDNVAKDNGDSLRDFTDFNRRTKPREIDKKMLKISTIKSLNALYEGREIVLTLFESAIFPSQRTKGSSNRGFSAPVAVVSDRLDLKVLTRKKMFQRLPIALVQIKPGNTSENSLS